VHLVRHGVEGQQRLTELWFRIAAKAGQREVGVLDDDIPRVAQVRRQDLRAPRECISPGTNRRAHPCCPSGRGWPTMPRRRGDRIAVRLGVVEEEVRDREHVSWPGDEVVPSQWTHPKVARYDPRVSPLPISRASSRSTARASRFSGSSTTIGMVLRFPGEPGLGLARHLPSGLTTVGDAGSGVYASIGLAAPRCPADTVRHISRRSSSRFAPMAAPTIAMRDSRDHGRRVPPGRVSAQPLRRAPSHR
jgi:hypothetical protein